MKNSIKKTNGKYIMNKHIKHKTTTMQKCISMF